jgi:hypothetical protein
MNDLVLYQHNRMKFKSIQAVINYLSKEDPSLLTKLEKEDITVSQYLFNMKTKRDPFNKYGKSIVSGKETKWNERSCKYNRIRDDEKDEYRKVFSERMIRIHKTDNLLTDPDIQKKMLQNRKISGYYKFKNGKELSYTGSYERNFLETLDVVFEWDTEDLILPAPMTFKYNDDDGKERFYIPDAFIPSLNLIVEIKASDNKHYRERDIALEMKKDRIIEDSEYRFIKIFDKDYNEFIKLTYQIRSANLSQNTV